MGRGHIRRSGEVDEPMVALREWMDAARSVDAVDVEIPAVDDPLRGLQSLIDKAREEERGEGGRALRRLEERIEAAQELPEARAYRQQAGDPLEVLEARMRGEYDDVADAAEEKEESASAADAPPLPKPGADSQEGRQVQMGRALEASLRQRALPGEVRAEVAARLAAVMDGASPGQVRQIWELVVFGDDALGEMGQDG